MSIGTGVVLFVIGAILSFALNIQVTWIDLHLVGYILMIAGVIVFVIGIVLLTRRRRAIATSRTADPINGDRITTRTTESDDPQIDDPRI
jgi:membrane-bound ClpP family serine protease